MVENGRGAKESTQTGGIHMKKGSYVKGNMVFVNINDYDFFCLMVKTCRFIETWELTNGPKPDRKLARSWLKNKRLRRIASVIACLRGSDAKGITPLYFSNSR